MGMIPEPLNPQGCRDERPLVLHVGRHDSGQALVAEEAYRVVEAARRSSTSSQETFVAGLIVDGSRRIVTMCK